MNIKAVILWLLSVKGIFSSQLPVNKERVSPQVQNSKLDKHAYLQFDLKYEQDTYFATTLAVGTPPQNITVLFDTGSADTWLMDTSNPFCEKNIDMDPRRSYNGTSMIGRTIDCSAIGTFTSNMSNSFELANDKRFYIQYEDKTFADGIWAKETFLFSNISVANVTFGLAEYATTPLGGVLGIGFERRESVTGYDNAPNKYYKNFPQILKDENIIDTAAYSLALSDESPSILFGSVNKNRFKGDLVTFPMINMYPSVVDNPVTLSLTLQGLGAKNPCQCEFETFMSIPYPVLLDSGSTLISAPTVIADKMASFIGAEWSELDQIYTLQCPNNVTGVNTIFTFDFGDIDIEVQLVDLILPPQDSSNTCAFGILRGGNEFILGDSFIKSTYLVYDLDNYLISIGKVNDDVKSTKEDFFIDIGKNGKIPGAKMATATPWKAYESFSNTTDMYSSSRVVCSTNTLSQSRSSKATSKSRNVIKSTEEVVNVDRMRVVTRVETLSKTKYATVTVCESKETKG